MFKSTRPWKSLLVLPLLDFVVFASIAKLLGGVARLCLHLRVSRLLWTHHPAPSVRHRTNPIPAAKVDTVVEHS